MNHFGISLFHLIAARDHSNALIVFQRIAQLGFAFSSGGKNDCCDLSFHGFLLNRRWHITGAFSCQCGFVIGQSYRCSDNRHDETELITCDANGDGTLFDSET